MDALTQSDLLEWVLSLPQRDEEVLTGYAPALLSRMLDRPTPVNVERLFELIPMGYWARGTSEPIVQKIIALPVKENRRDIVLAGLRMTSALLDIEVVPPIDCAAWAESLISLLDGPFAVVEATTTAMLKVARQGVSLPMYAILDALFSYLGPDHAIYHVRAVELLWEVNQLAEMHTFENVIAARLTRSFDAFGTLWRLTDDTMLPGELFFTPAMMILDALGDPVRQQAETWLRCNLASPFR